MLEALGLLHEQCEIQADVVRKKEEHVILYEEEDIVGDEEDEREEISPQQ